MLVVGSIDRQNSFGGLFAKDDDQGGDLLRFAVFLRKVVRKVIRSQATEFHYHDVQPQPKIGPWRERLDSLLLENDGKPARERLTLIRVFEELRALGYEGGYDAVRRYARAWGGEHASETLGARMCRCRSRRARGLPVRLEPRDRRDGLGDDDRKGRARSPPAIAA